MRVSKYVTNASKTAVMDVTEFLRASLGSSTVHLHESQGGTRACACSGAGFYSQIGEEECDTEEQRSVVHFLWAEGLNAKDP
jgi:hypothetical protein